MTLNRHSAINTLRQLPEVKKIRQQAQRRGLRVAFLPAAEMVKVDGQCRLSIAAYVDHPDRFEMRQVFLVDRRSRATHILSNDGDYITLREWRATPH